MFKLWVTIKKDVRILFRDKVAIALMFVMPIALVIVITSVQNSTFQLVNKNRLSILVTNLDTGQASAQMVKAIGKIGMFKVSLTAKDPNPKTLAEQMRSKDAVLGIIIPADFSARISARSKNIAGKALTSFGLQGDSTKSKPSGGLNPLTFYFNPVLQESIRLSVKGALQSSLQMVQSRETLRSLYYSINEKQLPDTLENEMLNNHTEVNEVPVSKDGTRTTPNATQHNVPAWTIFAMFFIIMSLGQSVVREKLTGSFVRLKTLPTNFLVALLSKQLTYLVITMLQALVIFSMGIYLFPYINLPRLGLPADIFALVLTTFVTGWCAVSYAICVGVFAESQEQSNGYGAVSIVILAAIGGLMVPSFAMQGFFKSAADYSPLHWSLEAYYALFLQGGTLKDVIGNLGALFGITVVIQILIYIGLKRKHLI